MGRATEDRGIDLKRVQRRFAAALPSYDENAQVQKRIVQQLLELLLAEGRTSFARVLEYGCGTGLLTQALAEHLQVDAWLLNDLVPQCADYVRVPNAQFIACPAEELQPETSFDLIVSASAFQWFKDPAQLLQKIKHLLRAEGRLLFNTFLPDNLYELCTLTDSNLPYLSEEELLASLQENFEIRAMQQDSITLSFPSLYDLLLHLRSTGVTATSRSNELWTPQRFANLEQAYRSQFSDAKGNLLLTYSPVLFLCAAR